MANNFFLTGYPGAGKSTLVKKLIAGLGVLPGGFCSRMKKRAGGGEELHLIPAGELWGFSGSENLAGRSESREGSSPGSSQDSNDGSRKTGRILIAAFRRHRGAPWQVDNGVFNRQGVELLERGLRRRKIIIMDELGRFELRADNFQQKVLETLDSPVPVIGVLKYERNQFLKEIWDNPGVEVFWVERANLDSLYRLLLKRLTALIK